ncbi:MAG: hypothetical protein B7W98_00505 [Parcubacteria group bacterium 20-58-5]|nr:MAG: hypothetical protein B7W98_00505 [Parcubacteria group bacterium 20-58-5]
MRIAADLVRATVTRLAPAQRSVALLERAPDGVRDVIAKCLADLLHDGVEVQLAEGLSAPAADGSYVQTVEVSLPRLDERLAALRYFAGWTHANNPAYAFYGDGVMEFASQFQQDINQLAGL